MKSEIKIIETKTIETKIEPTVFREGDTMSVSLQLCPFTVLKVEKDEN